MNESERPECFGKDFDPDDQECVPSCLLFIECYNEFEESVRR